jgi:hypothetical protein
MNTDKIPEFMAIKNKKIAKTLQGRMRNPAFATSVRSVAEPVFSTFCVSGVFRGQPCIGCISGVISVG